MAWTAPPSSEPGTDVGTDTWYFHFAPDTYRLVGYQFYHDEATGRGEYIFLADEREVLGMKIPVERRWFTNAEDRYLGTDVLVGHAGGTGEVTSQTGPGR